MAALAAQDGSVWLRACALLVGRRLSELRLRAARRRPVEVELDQHTRRDIGIEPGEITWM